MMRAKRVDLQRTPRVPPRFGDVWQTCAMEHDRRLKLADRTPHLGAVEDIDVLPLDAEGGIHAWRPAIRPAGNAFVRKEEVFEQVTAGKSAGAGHERHAAGRSHTRVLPYCFS